MEHAYARDGSTVRVAIRDRAHGVLADDEMVWFRLGAPVDYEPIISRR